MQHLKIILLIHWLLAVILFAEDIPLARVEVTETANLERSKEYVEFRLQTDSGWRLQNFRLAAVDEKNAENIPVQVFDVQQPAGENIVFCSAIFPLRLSPGETRTLLLKALSAGESERLRSSDLKMNGEGLELRIENGYYRADLTKNPHIEPQSHESGQIRELLIKMGFDQLLSNAEDRLHWAPNFKRPELEFYTTIAHWEKPRKYSVDRGNYLIRTLRQDLAPDHPEILLTAVYKFYANMPYFKFYSEMNFVNDLGVELLRNDEMTMDSIFTHLAFQRPDGRLVDVEFAQRYELLKKQPIENDAPWICFYNAAFGFAFGSIRLKYDNSNEFGGPSPVYLPHTQIGEWLGGIKYWNRRLVHDHLTFIPRGSRYAEENAYLVFKIGKKDRFEEIKYRAERLRRPVRVRVIPITIK
jgi:hypothetical protein